MKSNSGYVPKVIIREELLKSYMIDFMMENLGRSINIYEYIGSVMFRLGFTTDDVIEFKDFNINDKEDYFICVVNGDEEYKIKFLNVGNRKLHSKIKFVNGNIGIIYECFPLRVSELGVRIIPVCEEIVYGEDISYIREYSREDAKYVIKNKEREVLLYVVKPKDFDLPLYDKCGKYSRYRLDNESKLVDMLLCYLRKCDNKDIVSMYKEICEISLGSDMNKYGELYLKYMDNGEITDIIYLKNGELERFGMTLPEMRRTLFLNKDGSWTYKMNNKKDLFSYSMDVIGDSTNYNVMVRDSVDLEFVSEIIQTDSIDVKENIENVKKLTKSIFDNR